MEISGDTWYILFTAIITSLMLVGFVIVLFINFLRKRTLGTILLAIFYFLLMLGEMSNTAGLWIYTFKTNGELLSGFLELNFTTFYGFGYIFLYYFANRHILDDNDIVKSFTSIILSGLVGITNALMSMELYFTQSGGFFYSVIPLTVDINQFLPSSISGLIILFPIFIFVHLRIVIGIIKLRKTAPDMIIKRGLLFILLAVVSFILSAIIASFFLIPEITINSPITIILHTFRILFIQIGLLLSYLGWILPDWFKRALEKNSS
ncbi:MAG: hypothetical protein FK734_09910 [Asgard group archaeon]|nr:hypothetical protein [Asgard group archaeon]